MRTEKTNKFHVASSLIGIVSLLVVFVLLSKTDKKTDEKIEGFVEPKRPLSVFEMEKRDITGNLPGQRKRENENIERPIIKSITFIPEQPTMLDNIKAEPSTDYDQGKVTYEYLWEINNKPIKDIKTDTLRAGLFKKGDAIRVIVTPSTDGLIGHPYESRFIIIHSAPPSLELKEMVQKLGDTIEFQLISKDPDGDKVTFSLEDPALEGMSINKETGKIIWKPKKKEKGIYKFRASAVDVDGVKISNTFEFRINIGD